MKIINIQYIKDYEIEVTYEDGQKHIFNLEQSIRNFINKYNRFHEMLDKEYFKSVRLNTDWNTIEWDNGFDYCPDLLQPVYATT